MAFVKLDDDLDFGAHLIRVCSLLWLLACAHAKEQRMTKDTSSDPRRFNI